MSAYLSVSLTQLYLMRLMTLYQNNYNFWPNAGIGSLTSNVLHVSSILTFESNIRDCSDIKYAVYIYAHLVCY